MIMVVLDFCFPLSYDNQIGLFPNVETLFCTKTNCRESLNSNDVKLSSKIYKTSTGMPSGSGGFSFK